MDEETQRWLLSNVDSNGNPKWEPPTFDDLSKEEIEGLPEDESVIEYEEVYEGDQFLLEDTWHIHPTVESLEDEQVDTRTRAIGLAVVLGVFLLALLPRLYVLFFVTDPQNPGLGWYGDAFHHWQIAYLSKEIGFSEGFLRLWDFKGMEYFWGLLHPLVLSGLFTIAGSVDIVIPRLLSAVSGSISVVFIFFLARRYFNDRVAIAASLFAALNPVSLFSDVSGMQEPLGVMLMLAGVLLWPRKSIATGILWALAGMVRAEYWLFGAGLVVASFFVQERNDRKLGLALGWAVPSLLYMKYLLDYTGNPIYPIYWNFLGNAAGEWMEDIPLNTVQIIAMWGFRLLTLISAYLAIRVLQKKPRHAVLGLLGLGNTLFLSVLLGFSAYVRGFLPRFLVDRIFLIPYIVLGLFIAVLVQEWTSRQDLKAVKVYGGWVIIFVVLGLSQWAWKPIWDYFEPGTALWPREHEVAEEIAANYEVGVISIPEDRPWLTYFLVHDYGITGRQLEGQMYDVFAYFEEDPFANWNESRGAVQHWLASRNIQLIAFYRGKENYEEMINREPQWFRQIATLKHGAMKLYEVNISGSG
jgi:hypothetical protein